MDTQLDERLCPSICQSVLLTINHSCDYHLLNQRYFNSTITSSATTFLPMPYFNMIITTSFESVISTLCINVDLTATVGLSPPLITMLRHKNSLSLLYLSWTLTPILLLPPMLTRQTMAVMIMTITLTVFFHKVFFFSRKKTKTFLLNSIKSMKPIIHPVSENQPTKPDVTWSHND